MSPDEGIDRLAALERVAVAAREWTEIGEDDDFAKPVCDNLVEAVRALDGKDRHGRPAASVEAGPSRGAAAPLAPEGHIFRYGLHDPKTGETIVLFESRPEGATMGEEAPLAKYLRDARDERDAAIARERHLEGEYRKAIDQRNEAAARAERAEKERDELVRSDALLNNAYRLERDRMREALESIRAYTHNVPHYACVRVAMIAKAALSPAPGGSSGEEA